MDVCHLPVCFSLRSRQLHKEKCSSNRKVSRICGFPGRSDRQGFVCKLTTPRFGHRQPEPWPSRVHIVILILISTTLSEPTSIIIFLCIFMSVSIPVSCPVPPSLPPSLSVSHHGLHRLQQTASHSSSAKAFSNLSNLQESVRSSESISPTRGATAACKHWLWAARCSRPPLANSWNVARGSETRSNLKCRWRNVRFTRL